MTIKVNTKRVITELLKINEHMVMDIIFDLYDIDALKEDFSKHFNVEINTENMVAVLGELIKAIMRRDKVSSVIFSAVIRRNRKYVEFAGYHKRSIDELRELFNQEKVPSLHREGVSPQMMILYWFSNNMFNHSMIPALVEEYQKWHSVAEAEARRYSETLGMKDVHYPSTEELIRRMFEEENLRGIEHVNWQEIARQFGCEYDEESRTFSKVKRGILLYLDTAIQEARDARSRYESETAVVRNHIKRAYNLIEKAVQHWKAYRKAVEENRKLGSEIKSLRKELRDLTEKYRTLSKSTPEGRQEELNRLMRENYYLKLTVERLEQRINELEKAEEINREIIEDLQVTEEQKVVVFPQLPEFQTIVIVGGRWTSDERGRLEDALRTCEVKFIEAEKTIARIDTIANADIVIFDTSRNAHKYYYLVKEKAGRLFMINRSTADAVMGLFVRQ